MEDTIGEIAGTSEAVKTFNERWKLPQGYYERSDGLVEPERLREPEPKIIIAGRVGEEMFRDVSNALTSLERKHSITNCLEVTLSSFGGSIYYGFGVHDLLDTFGRAHKVPVIITGYGPIMSMGAFIIQAGDVRCIPKNSTMLLHPLGGGENASGPLDYVRAHLEEIKRLQEIYTRVVAERAQRAGNMEMTAQRVEEMMKANSNVGTYLTAQQALDLKLIDRIV